MAKSRIMVVEDEPIAAMDIQAGLEDLGYEVPAVASSGEEAIRLAADISPDLILMDITLAGAMTGVEAAGRIRQAQQIPVIFLTAHQDRDTVVQARTAEPFGYLNKPCDRLSLRNTIEVALYKSAADARARDAEERLRLGLQRLVDERTGDFERTNQELFEFCYALSHELRAPIARLQGMSAALLEECSACPREKPRIFAERIHHASLQQRKVVDSILTLSRISRIELQRREVDLSAMADRISEVLRAEGSRPAVSIAVAPGLKALADPVLMQICLENLLRNAVKFTAHTPEARVEFGRERQDGGDVYFVRDNGAGFDMKYVEKLFVPFQRLHSQTGYPGTGNGIGLATVSRIVKRHGGRIWATSETDLGATFFFTLTGC